MSNQDLFKSQQVNWSTKVSLTGPKLLSNCTLKSFMAAVGRLERSV